MECLWNRSNYKPLSCPRILPNDTVTVHFRLIYQVLLTNKLESD